MSTDEDGTVRDREDRAVPGQRERVAGAGHPPGAPVPALVWDEGLSAYDFGPTHPLKPVRVELTVALIRELGLLDGPARQLPPGDLDVGELLRVHDGDYVEAVRRAGEGSGTRVPFGFGLGAGDNPVFPDMHEASLRVCAATRRAAGEVVGGRAVHAFSPAGGLHHAMPGRASGFCVYNDPAVAIAGLLSDGAERIAYVDIDVHHGDGVQEIFYDDPRVLTVSLHESGRSLFPGTGFPDETGGAGAEGSAVNVPLYPRTAGEVWLECFDAVVEPLVRAFAPDVLCTQLGCDTHATDPLAHLMLTVDDMRSAVARLHRLAHEAAGGRWVAFGGGGYQLVQVVPRAWTGAFAEMAGVELPEVTPEAWRDLARQRAGEEPPERFAEEPVGVVGAGAGRIREAARESVAAVRELVFPHHGL